MYRTSTLTDPTRENKVFKLLLSWHVHTMISHNSAV